MRQPARELPDGFHLLRLEKGLLRSLQLKLRRAPLGQVARDLRKADEHTVLVADRVENHAGPEARSVLALAPPFGCEPAFALGRLQRRPGYPRFDVLRRVKAREVLADDLLGGVALDMLGAGVP